MLLKIFIPLIIFNLIDGVVICENILNLKYFNYISLLLFLVITLFTRFLRGTSKNHDIYISYYLFIISRIVFFCLYLNFFIYFFLNKFYSNYIFYIIPLYLPFYLDGAEFTGNYKLSNNHPIRKNLYKLFQYSSQEIYIKDQGLYLNEPSLLGIHPHGLIPLGLVNNFSLNPKRKEIFLRHLPHAFNSGMGTGATFNFFFPIIREFYLIIGAIDCSKPIIKKFLNKNFTVGVFIGGGRECKYSGIGKTNLIINKRLGFFKLALETGRPVVPIYTFGENNFFNAFNVQNFFLFELFHRLTGLWFPLGYFSFKKTKIITVIGDPIFVNKVENPTTKDIINLQNKYKKNLVELFDYYKHLDPNCINKTLNFIE